jgi:hypothetical protein
MEEVIVVDLLEVGVDEVPAASEPQDKLPAPEMVHAIVASALFRVTAPDTVRVLPPLTDKVFPVVVNVTLLAFALVFMKRVLEPEKSILILLKVVEAVPPILELVLLPNLTMLDAAVNAEAPLLLVQSLATFRVVKVPALKVPEVSVRLATDIVVVLPPTVKVCPDLATVTLLKDWETAVPFIFCPAEVLLKFTTPVEIKVPPLFVQLPETFRLTTLFTFNIPDVMMRVPRVRAVTLVPVVNVCADLAMVILLKV